MTIHISHNPPVVARKGWQRDALLSLYFGLGLLGSAKVSNFAQTIHVQVSLIQDTNWYKAEIDDIYIYMIYRWLDMQ